MKSIKTTGDDRRGVETIGWKDEDDRMYCPRHAMRLRQQYSLRTVSIR